MRKKVTEKGAGGAATVQLLGTIDDLVSPDDNVDLVSGKDFVYLEVPASGHKNVIDMDNSDAGLKRQRALYEAFAVDPDSTNTRGPITSSISVQPKVTDVVFVIHGIRDEGYWTRKIAYRAQRAGGGVRVATETSSYGYFPMLSFLRPGARQEKVEWLMDRYTEAKAIYPNARFHYFGHSHGTYLLAKALEDYPAVHFDQVIFAGSVVRRDYEWHKLMPHRVKSVVNFVATADWVVAFFPNALQSVGFQDLGSAGHHGFDDARTNSGLIQPPQMYVTGGHGAALQEAMWDSIAEFMVSGNFRPPPSALLSSTQAKWVVWPARVAPLWWIVIAGLLAWGGYELATLPVREWKKTLALVAYCSVIWTVLTRV